MKIEAIKLTVYFEDNFGFDWFREGTNYDRGAPTNFPGDFFEEVDPPNHKFAAITDEFEFHHARNPDGVRTKLPPLFEPTEKTAMRLFYLNASETAQKAVKTPRKANLDPTPQPDDETPSTASEAVLEAYKKMTEVVALEERRLREAIEKRRRLDKEFENMEFPW